MPHTVSLCHLERPGGPSWRWLEYVVVKTLSSYILRCTNYYLILSSLIFIRDHVIITILCHCETAVGNDCFTRIDSTTMIYKPALTMSHWGCTIEAWRGFLVTMSHWGCTIEAWRGFLVTMSYWGCTIKAQRGFIVIMSYWGCIIRPGGGFLT